LPNATGFNAKKYVSAAWKNLPQGSPREALQDVSQKLGAFANDFDRLPIMAPGFIMPWLGEACPPGWELVTSMIGNVMLGVAEHDALIGKGAGSMSHTNSIPLEPSGLTGLTNIDGHTHSEASSTGIIKAGTGADVTVVTSIAANTGGATSTSHQHSTPAHSHGGVTGSADHTPAHIKVLFCRRKA
jgi:hypothetical protein